MGGGGGQAAYSFLTVNALRVQRCSMTAELRRRDVGKQHLHIHIAAGTVSTEPQLNSILYTLLQSRYNTVSTRVLSLTVS